MTWQKSYVYAGSRLLSTFTNDQAGGETLEFDHPDRLGTKLVTDASGGGGYYEQSTLPFGTNLPAETTGATNQRFTSYDRNATTGLDYAVNRSYSPGIGRFTSVDPIGMSAASITNPQSMNLYAYAQNNPVDYTDPSGLLRAALDDVIRISTWALPWGWADVFFSGIDASYGGDFDWLYDPYYGGGDDFGGGGPGNLNTGDKAVFKEENFQRCLSLIHVSGRFKVDTKSSANFEGSFNVPTLSLKLETNIEARTKDSKELATMLNIANEGETNFTRQSGVTLGSQPRSAFVASDVVNNKKFSSVGIMAVFIHELGNSIAAQLLGGRAAFHDFGVNGDNDNDKDFGTNFEECVFGGIVGLQSGRIGSSRELP